MRAFPLVFSLCMIDLVLQMHARSNRKKKKKKAGKVLTVLSRMTASHINKKKHDFNDKTKVCGQICKLSGVPGVCILIVFIRHCWHSIRCVSKKGCLSLMA